MCCEGLSNLYRDGGARGGSLLATFVRVCPFVVKAWEPQRVWRGGEVQAHEVRLSFFSAGSSERLVHPGEQTQGS